jgi:Icc-related predicted phosphoesterase
MIVCHLSDWHGKKHETPDADLYIVTGDMLRNYPRLSQDGHGFSIFKKIEQREQSQFILHDDFRSCLGNKKAPVIVVRGNHDFINLGQWIGGEVYEFGSEFKVVELLGYKFGGFRGVPYISGCWTDELRQSDDLDFGDKIASGLDFLVTHAPPYGIMDFISKQDQRHLGLLGAARWINGEMVKEHSPLKGHFFGHIHEQFGCRFLGGQKKILFSNAATGYIVYDLKNDVIQNTGYFRDKQ